MRETIPSKASSVESDDGTEDETQIEEVQKSTIYDDTDYDESAIVLENGSDEVVPSFGNVSVMNSNDVHFGNKTIYQGPVTIKQFLYNGTTPSNGIEDAAKCVTNGVDNPVFVNTEADDKDDIVKDVDAVENNTPHLRKGMYILENFPHKKIVIISLIVMLLISLVILLTILLSKHTPKAITQITEETDEQETVKPIRYDLDENLTLSSKLRMVIRAQWVAQPPLEPANKLKTPVPYVIIHHTATENCTSQASCTFQTRLIQQFHIESFGWWDIGYNFLVGGDGSAYEGRGWTAEGAHLRGYNAQSIGIAFIGTFMKYKPPEIQMTACKKLIEKGVKEGYISKDYKLLVARQLQTTESPGLPLYEEIKKWPHWAPKP